MPFDTPSRIPPSAIVPRDSHAVAVWLLAVAFLIWVMVALGGATRLTGSGLSIMEWAPLRGMLPPLSDAEWNRLYDLYRTIPQYELVNAGFGIEGFKRIFWLEWIHRFWGRLIGLAYAGGLAWFWLRGSIPQGYKTTLVLFLVLGGAQGAIGWFMVASGFEADRTAVSPYRLVIHLGLALVLFAALVWTALGLLRGRAEPTPGETRLRPWLHAASGLAFVTMLAGGFVAGIHAGFSFNTFPLMDGQWLPDGYWQLSPAWHNMVANVLAVQFNHRLLATLTLLVAGIAGWKARGLPAGIVRRGAMILLAAIGLQYALGVATLLAVVPVALGTLHQAVAVLVLAAAIFALHTVRRVR